MFDNEAELENLSDTEQRSGDKDATPLAQWCVLLSMIVFCLVYLPFKHHPWSLAVALAVSYTVFVFGIALSLVLKDVDDFFGDPRVPGYVTTLLVPHAPIAALVTFAGYCWIRFKPMFPPWLTEGHKPLWMICGALVWILMGLKEAGWLAVKLNRKLKHEESADSD